MGNVLRMDKQQIIHGFINLGFSDRDINRKTGIHRKTISRYRLKFQSVPKVPADFLAQKGQSVPKVLTDFLAEKGQSVPEVPIVSERLPPTNSSQIQPHMTRIHDKFLNYGLTAQRIYQDLVEDEEFKGSYDSIRRYTRKLRKKVKKYFYRLPTLPGREAQVDFSKGALVWDGKKHRRAWLFKMTLSFSRHSYEELVWHQDLETFIRCHENAFRFFGGVPETIKLDNLKSGVLKACLFEPEINATYLAFSRHWGFIPNPCAPAKPHHKGRVERDIQYTESNALRGRKFESLDKGNLFLRTWNKRWARTRVHGTTKKQVGPLFEQEERPRLKPLAEKSFPMFKSGKRKVDVHGHIEVAGSFYSVPYQLVSEVLDVQYNKQWVKVLKDNEVVAQHRTELRKGKCVTIHAHEPAYKPQSLEQYEGWQCTRAKEIGPNCYKVVHRVLCRDTVLGIRRTRGILSLVKRFPSPAVEQACGLALSHRNTTYSQIKGICEHLTKKKETQTQIQFTQHDDLIRDSSEYHSLIQERNSK